MAEPPAIVDEATQAVVIQNLLLTAQSLQSEGETSAASAHAIYRCLCCGSVLIVPIACLWVSVLTVPIACVYRRSTS